MSASAPGAVGATGAGGAAGAIAALERLVRRDRLLMLGALTILVLLAIAWLVRDAARMHAMPADMPMRWGAAEWWGLLLMWAVMMVAMMLPSAAPVILLVLAMLRRRGDARAPQCAHLFVAGYLLAWTAFSALAATLQFELHRSAIMAMDMRLRPGIASAAVLLLAGAFQFTPLKRACLSHCRSPLDALARYWREGSAGAVLAGLRHGSYCVGCCWVLMLVLLVVGVMKLAWVAALAAMVLLEKSTARGPLVGRVAGVALIAWGAWLLNAAWRQ
jgi:predicted metal-binding membrane protein